MSRTAAELRREKLRRLGGEPFDLLVVGGGINGAAVAREAALRGVRAALVEQGDFASGTSSRSSKLIHGGFRYLQTGDFRLVLEASHERDLLRRRLAPHLVRSRPFFFPVYAGGPMGRWKLRAGLALYDLLAVFRNVGGHRMLGAAEAAATEPELASERLRGAALYYDCVTDDARLVLETVLGAEAAGAVCLNYVSVESFDREEGRITGAAVLDRVGEGARLHVRARTVVNAAGPWVDRVRALDEPAAPPVVRLTKGVHVVLPRQRVGNRNAVVLQVPRDGRILFVIPWEDHALVGTTDTDYEGAPGEVCAEAADVDYLLSAVNAYFPRARLKERDVVSSFAGLRALVDGRSAGSPSEVSREEELFESRSGLLSLAGGKLTTHRRVAVRVVDRVARRLRDRFGVDARSRSGTAALPLPGGGGAAEASADAPLEVVELLRRRYGSRAAGVLALLSSSPALAGRLSAAAPAVRAEARFAAETEMAVRVEDVLRRRTTVALRSRDGGAAAAEATAALMGEDLGWTRSVVEREAREYVESLTESARPWRQPA